MHASGYTATRLPIRLRNSSNGHNVPQSINKFF